MIFLNDNPQAFCKGLGIADKSGATLVGLDAAEFVFACNGYMTKRVTKRTLAFVTPHDMPEQVVNEVMTEILRVMAPFQQQSAT